MQLRKLAAALPEYDVHPIRQVTAAEGALLGRLRLLIFSMVALILVLTSLCVLATMAALAIERREDVGLMKALGGSISRVVGLFLAEVGVLGAVGGAIGCIVGMVLTRWMGHRVFEATISMRWEIIPAHNCADDRRRTGRRFSAANAWKRETSRDLPRRIVAPLVQVEGLRKEYGHVRALDGVSFQVNAGEWIAFMGPSGSGKTTLINILGGLDTPTAGQAVVDGTDVARLDEAGLTRFRAEKIGFVFQQFHLVSYLTALENVMLAQYFHSTTDENEARLALERVGLGDRVKHLPSQLSGGEQQRVAVARALINHPKLILADEPTGNLDEANAETVIRLLRELHDQGHTILMVTHDPAIGQLADRRIDLAHGRIVQISEFSEEDEIRFDHLLEQVWICGEEGIAPALEKIRQSSGADPMRIISRLADLKLLELRDSEVSLTAHGENRARDIVRRRRLAERLLTDTFSIADSEADSHACKFEHIISPELDQRICAFLGHPQTCPHGNPIPPGRCCPSR